MGESLTFASGPAKRSRRGRIVRAMVLCVPVVTLLGVATLLVKAFAPSAHEVDCVTASRTMSPGNAVLVCQREYQRTRHPLTGSYLADVLRRSGDLTGAGGIASELLGTEVRGDALQILAKIAVTQNRVDDAIAALREARPLHRDNHAELARDDLALAEIHTKAKHYPEALQMLEECISESRSAKDRLTEGYCHLAAGRALMSAGYFAGSHEELDRAEPLLAGERDLALLWYWRGNLDQEVLRAPSHNNHNAQAVVEFQKALEYATRAQLSSLLVNIQMNLAFSLAETDRCDEADRHLQDAGVLDSHGQYANERAELAARIAYRRGNLSLAFSLNEAVFPKLSDDEKIEVSVVQARIALARHDLAAATTWARRGADSAEKIRLSTPTGELRPWILSSRREPLELLFSALARAGEVEDAIEVFDRWQGRALLDVMARPSPEPSPGLSATAATIQNLSQWLPAASIVPIMASDRRSVTKTLGKIDLVGLAIASDEHGRQELWRLAASRGRFKLESLGSVDALRERLDRFRGKPTERPLADELGALLVPDEVVRKTTDPLYVVLDAQLAAVPFVALRRNDQPLIATRPVIRAPRLPTAVACEPRTDVGDPVVLADAAGDLPDARRESSKVASLFGTTPLIGEAATSAALLGAKSVRLMHIAVHGDIDAGGGLLRLHDRAVSAPEISASQLKPSLVVLSSCSTATASDPELAGSLSTAFLAAGAGRVIATLRPVSDAGSRDLMTRFYDARGADDPVHVLASVQATLGASNDPTWPYFAVFSNEVCTPRQ